MSSAFRRPVFGASILAALSLCLFSMGRPGASLPPTAYLPSVSTANGSATVQIPIDLPPGFAPKLSLVYQADSGAGMAGAGWSLAGLDAIYRDPARLNYNSTDRFLSPDGALTFDGSAYRGRENPHIRYQLIGPASNPTGFTATGPDASVRTYGGTSDTNVKAPGAPGYYAWALRRVTDPGGNEYLIEYNLDRGSHYPARITYESAGGSTRVVDFAYEARPDAVAGNTWRGPVTESLRLSEINVDADGGAYRTYQFQYDVSPHTGQSRLTRLTARTGKDTEIFTQTFTYDSTNPGMGGVRPVYNHGGTWPAGSTTYMDFNGDGRVDVLHQNYSNTFYVALSNGSGFDGAQVWAQHGSGAYNSFGAQYADVNGDGRPDLIYRGTDNVFHVSLSNGSSFAGGGVWITHGGPFLAGQARYADVNGDGLADLIFQGADNVFNVSLSTGTGFTPSASWMQHGGSFAAGQAQYADMNGDGKADLIYQGNENKFYVSLSTGTSFTPPAVWMQHGGGFVAGQAQYADVNGDGLPDLIFQSNDNRFYVSLSTGNGFGAPWEWFDHGESFVAGRARYLDVNGDGKADLIYQNNNNAFHVSLSTGQGFAAPTVWMTHGDDPDEGRASYGDINGDGRPELINHGTTEIMASYGLGGQADLLKAIDNGSASLSLEYQPAVDHPGLLQPQRNTPRRFALADTNVLTAVNRSIGGSPTERTTYTYANMMYRLAADPDERRMLGSEYVTQRSYVYDGGWIEQPTFAVTQYDQDANGSNVVRTETRLSNNDSVIGLQTNSYTTLPASHPGAAPLRVSTEQTSEQYSTTGTLQKQTRRTMSNYDAFGQPRTITDGGNLAATGDDVRTEIVYAGCAPGRPGTVRKYDSSNALIDRTETQYDANCRPIQVMKGFNGNTSTSTIAYAPDGRPATLGRDGLTQTIGYDGETTTVTAPNGTTKTIRVDPSSGLPIETTDANGNTTVTEYDDFNRPVRKCSGTTALCATNPIKEETNYGALTPTGGEIQIADSLGRIRTMTIDERGRNVRTVTADDHGTVTAANTFDTFGRTVTTSVAGIERRRNTYDANGQTVRIDTPGPNGTIQTTPDTEPLPVVVGNRAGLEYRGTDATGQTIYEVRDGKRLLQRDYPTEENGSAAWGRDRYTYDARGLVTKIQRGYGSTRSAIAFDGRYEITITYDELGRKTSQTEADRGTIGYAYHANGKLAQKLQPDGTSIHYDYDTIGRLIRRRQGTQTIASYTYENGKPKTITDNSGTRTFYHDSRGRLTRQARTFETGKVFDITYEYDTYNRPIKKRIDGSNLELEYAYFNTGELKSITLHDPDHHTMTDDSRVLVRHEKLTEQGKPQKAYYGNGVEISYEYQPETGLLTAMRAENGDPLADLSYTYRDDALLAAITDNAGGEHTESYTYDAAHRLKEATGPYGDETTPTKTISYRYAADGQMIENGETETTQNYTGPKPHQLTNSNAGLTYQYNPRGSVKQKTAGNNRVDITYNTLNRPDRIDVQDAEGKTSTTSLTYTDRGRRFKKDYTGAGENVKTYYLEKDYQVRIKDTTELHTLIVRKPDGLLCTLSYELPQLTAAAGYDTIYLGRAFAVTGIGLAAWQERGENLRRFFKYWKHANLFLVLLAAVSITVGMIGLSRATRERAVRILSETDALLTRPRRVTAFLTAQILLVNLVFLPALGCVNNGGSLPESASDLVGNHYFISNHLRSNFLVTNDAGKAVTKYVYMPYGKLNDALTNEDLDGDGVAFQTTEKYTGQEFDYESGLYNYNARMYDPETGRFLQTDPKHKDMPGWSNYDRYSYVHGNPINMIDPSGEIGLLSALGAWAAHDPKGYATAARNITNGFDWAKKSISGGFGAAAKNIENGFRRMTEGPNYNRKPEYRQIQEGIQDAIGTNRMDEAFRNFINGANIPGHYSLNTIFGLPGYIIGGFSTSSLNNIHWDEVAARQYRDFFVELGPRVALVGVAVALAWIGGGPGGVAGLAGLLISNVGGTYVDFLDLVERLQEGPRRRPELSSRGIVGQILSEYDYNNDGRLDMLEMGIGNTTGYRRSAMDGKHYSVGGPNFTIAGNGDNVVQTNEALLYYGKLQLCEREPVFCY